MSREETTNLLMVIQAAYPNYHPQDKTIAVNTWHMMLEDYSYQIVQQAVKAYIAADTSGFAPSIGQIIDKIQFVTTPEELSDMEAWDKVSRAISRSSYFAKEEFEKLPELVKKAVGSADQLQKWAAMDSSKVESVVQSNFIKTYRTVVERDKSLKKMPADVRKLIDSINNGRLGLEG